MNRESSSKTMTRPSNEKKAPPKYIRVRFFHAIILSFSIIIWIQTSLHQTSTELFYEQSFDPPWEVDATNPEYENLSFCKDWRAEDALNRTLQPFDEWWAHHPTWAVINETGDMFCVGPMDNDSDMTRDFSEFHKNQFHRPCEHIYWRTMWSSGWSADFTNVQNGLVESTDKLHIPLVVGITEPWHYAANKVDGSNKTCPQADMTCYFLPYHNCGSLEEIEMKSDDIQFIENDELSDEGDIEHERGRSAYFFLTRKQLWLRRAVYDATRKFRSSFDAESDCTVIHVRRSDVVLHRDESRKYYPVADYVNLIPKDRLTDSNHTILLLTDDANAIGEAHDFFPDLRWKYLNRTRHKGSSGGWEDQTPSRDPAAEVITLLQIFDLVQDCSTFVNGESGLADIIWEHMKLSGRHDLERFWVDKDNETEEFSLENGRSEFELKKNLNELRRQQKKGTTENTSRHGSDLIDSNSTVKTKGLIVVNILGLLANDLFEAAFAARLSEQLGWKVVYRTSWNPAFPTRKTDSCFPNIARDGYGLKHKKRRQTNDSIRTLLLDVSDHVERAFNMNELYDALMYNELEPMKYHEKMDQDEANDILHSWIKSLGENVITIEHMGFPVVEDNVDNLVEDLKSPDSTVRVLNLKGFFIHYDWMQDWLTPTYIHHWLHINQDEKCCSTPAPDTETIAIHIRDFEPEDEDKNKNLALGVYSDIINKYYSGSPEVWVICQPKSVKSVIVKALVKEFGATVHTGSDNIDALCILSRARIHIPSTSSSFSQLAALLAEGNIDEEVEVHYPTHTLDYPDVTLKVPSWKYHLTNENNDGIEEFDVDHSRLYVTQS